MAPETSGYRVLTNFVQTKGSVKCLFYGFRDIKDFFSIKLSTRENIIITPELTEFHSHLCFCYKATNVVYKLWSKFLKTLIFLWIFCEKGFCRKHSCNSVLELNACLAVFRGHRRNRRRASFPAVKTLETWHKTQAKTAFVSLL